MERPKWQVTNNWIQICNKCSAFMDGDFQTGDGPVCKLALLQELTRKSQRSPNIGKVLTIRDVRALDIKIISRVPSNCPNEYTIPYDSPLRKG